MRLQGRIATRIAAGLLAVAGAAFALDRLFPPDLSRLAETSVTVTDRDGTILRAFTTSAGTWRLPVETAEIDPLYLGMLRAYEDGRFGWHLGVDPLAVLRAAWQAATRGRVVSGASTLTMQTARLLEPRPRTLGTKLIEMARAVQLEWRFTKPEILRAYLTLAPFGGNLEGVRAASLAYFAKEPRGLSPAEAALLVALPQAPSLRRPDRHPEAAVAAMKRVLDRAVAAGVIDAGRAAEAAGWRPPAERAALPFLAPQLARRLAGTVSAGSVRTTLDAGLQAALERLAASEGQWFADGADIAIVVVENAGARVRAWVGSRDFAGPAGQIDYARAVRSPGSALKPFVYAMGFAEPGIQPETRIDDRPLSFGDYSPQNFDRMFHGRLTLREALQQSLNLPAVAVMQRVGPERFVDALRRTGTDLRLPQAGEPPGLAIALGGAGISLADLTALYVALANGGLHRPLAVRGGTPPAEPVRLLEARAAAQVTEILAAAPRPDTLGRAGVDTDARRVAYKTGTSYGYRDAWAIGYGQSHTAGVWVGRADGSPRPGAYGRVTAAPILFRVFDILPGFIGVPPPAAAPERVASPLNAALPEPQRRMRSRREEGPRILFPPDGALVELPRAGDGALATLSLRAGGGRPPFRWVVNGLPLANPLHRAEPVWKPDSEGIARITVIDADERNAAVEVTLRAESGTAPRRP